jgi:hypothetical protein
MRVEKRNGYRVVVGGPVPPQAEAITLGATIFVRKRSCEHQGLMAHELVHIRQFKEMGPVRFLARYLASYLRYRLSGYCHMAAYRRIPLEVEASWVSRLHSVTDLEPGNDIQVSRPESHAHALRERLRRHGGARANGRRATPRGGTWNRPSTPRNLEAVQAAMAPRDASDAASR